MIDPCSTSKSTDSEWGCHEFVGSNGFNFEVVDKKPMDDYDAIVTGTAQQRLPNRTRQRIRAGKPKREEKEEEEKQNIHAFMFKA